MRTYTDKLRTIEIKALKPLSLSALKDTLKLANDYDWHASRIDDFATYKKAIDQNNIIATYISLYDIVSFKYYDTKVRELESIAKLRKENNIKGYENV